MSLLDAATGTPRRVAHLDMDAFYAAVELLRRPALRGRPLVVGGRWRPASHGIASSRIGQLGEYSGRGVVTTSTYEARALGVFSGMSLMQAARLAPRALLVPADFDAYRHYSRLFKAAVAAIAPRIEDRGIDEIYIDLTEVPGESAALAQHLKEAVREATGLCCTVGVAPNKLLAKLGSQLAKPDGLTVLHGPADVPRRIWPLPVHKVNGIGPRACATLVELGVQTIGDLAQIDPVLLRAHFSRRYAAWLHQIAHGRDERPVIIHAERKSISRETTFERDLHPRRDRALLAEIFTALCHRVADDLRRHGCLGKVIGIKLRDQDFRTVTRAQTLPLPTAEATAIRRAAAACLRRAPLERKLRLLGVRAGALCHGPTATAGDVARQGELPLFNDAPR